MVLQLLLAPEAMLAALINMLQCHRQTTLGRSTTCMFLTPLKSSTSDGTKDSGFKVIYFEPDFEDNKLCVLTMGRSGIQNSLGQECEL